VAQHIVADDAVKNLGAAIILQMLKDYFGEPTAKEKKNGDDRWYNKGVIKKILKSDYLYNMTDGLNLTVLRKLKANENAVKENMKLLAKDD
jgi:hypothetical protein